MELVLLDRFVKSKQRKLSVNTLKGYESDIKNFLVDIIEANKCGELEAIQMITPEMAEDFVNDYIKKEEDGIISKGTINRKLASLTLFYDYLRDTLYKVTINPFKNIDRFSSVESRTRDSLSLEETRRLIEETYKRGDDKQFEFASARTRFMIALITTTGMRIEEVLNIELSFIEQIGDNYIIEIPSHLTKGGYTRRVPICGKVKQYYIEYLAQREKLGVDSNLLILSNSKKKLKTQNSRDAIQKYVKRLGIEKNIGNHSFRHTFRTVATSQNVNEGLICCIGGWSRKSLGNQSDIYLHDTRELDNVKIDICSKIL